MLQIVVEAACNVCVNHDPHALEFGAATVKNGGVAMNNM
jgi:hypothetical protein